jgi:hypothetical protein
MAMHVSFNFPPPRKPRLDARGKRQVRAPGKLFILLHIEPDFNISVLNLGHATVHAAADALLNSDSDPSMFLTHSRTSTIFTEVLLHEGETLLFRGMVCTSFSFTLHSLKSL